MPVARQLLIALLLCTSAFATLATPVTAQSGLESICDLPAEGDMSIGAIWDGTVGTSGEDCEATFGGLPVPADCADGPGTPGPGCQEVLNLLCPLGGNFPACDQPETSVGDGFVAHFTFPNAGDTADAGIIVLEPDTDGDLQVLIKAYQGEGPATGSLQLKAAMFKQEPAEPNTCPAGEPANGPENTPTPFCAVVLGPEEGINLDTDGTATFEFNAADLPSTPAGVNGFDFFVYDAGRGSSHFFFPKNLLLEGSPDASALAFADTLELVGVVNTVQVVTPVFLASASAPAEECPEGQQSTPAGCMPPSGTAPLCDDENSEAPCIPPSCADPGTVADCPADAGIGGEPGPCEEGDMALPVIGACVPSVGGGEGDCADPDAGNVDPLWSGLCTVATQAGGELGQTDFDQDGRVDYATVMAPASPPNPADCIPAGPAFPPGCGPGGPQPLYIQLDWFYSPEGSTPGYTVASWIDDVFGIHVPVPGVMLLDPATGEVTHSDNAAYLTGHYNDQPEHAGLFLADEDGGYGQCLVCVDTANNRVAVGAGPDEHDGESATPGMLVPVSGFALDVDAIDPATSTERDDDSIKESGQNDGATFAVLQLPTLSQASRDVGFPDGTGLDLSYFHVKWPGSRGLSTDAFGAARYSNLDDDYNTDAQELQCPGQPTNPTNPAAYCTGAGGTSASGDWDGDGIEHAADSNDRRADIALSLTFNEDSAVAGGSAHEAPTPAPTFDISCAGAISGTVLLQRQTKSGDTVVSDYGSPGTDQTASSACVSTTYEASRVQNGRQDDVTVSYRLKASNLAGDEILSNVVSFTVRGNSKPTFAYFTATCDCNPSAASNTYLLTLHDVNDGSADEIQELSGFFENGATDLPMTYDADANSLSIERSFNAGTATVMLTIRDSGGATTVVEEEFTVEGTPPVPCEIDLMAVCGDDVLALTDEVFGLLEALGPCDPSGDAFDLEACAAMVGSPDDICTAMEVDGSFPECIVGGGAPTCETNDPGALAVPCVPPACITGNPDEAIACITAVACPAGFYEALLASDPQGAAAFMPCLIVIPPDEVQPALCEADIGVPEQLCGPAPTPTANGVPDITQWFLGDCNGGQDLQHSLGTSETAGGPDCRTMISLEAVNALIEAIGAADPTPILDLVPDAPATPGDRGTFRDGEGNFVDGDEESNDNVDLIEQYLLSYEVGDDGRVSVHTYTPSGVTPPASESGRIIIGDDPATPDITEILVRSDAGAWTCAYIADSTGLAPIALHVGEGSSAAAACTDSGTSTDLTLDLDGGGIVIRYTEEAGGAPVLGIVPGTNVYDTILYTPAGESVLGSEIGMARDEEGTWTFAGPGLCPSEVPEVGEVPVGADCVQPAPGQDQSLPDTGMLEDILNSLCGEAEGSFPTCLGGVPPVPGDELCDDPTTMEEVEEGTFPDCLADGVSPDLLLAILCEADGATTGMLAMFLPCDSDNVGPTLGVTASDNEAAEAAANDAPGAFTVSRSGDANLDLDVTLEVSGDAAHGADYTLRLGANALEVSEGTVTVTIPADQSSVVIDLLVIDDNLEEDAETVVLTIEDNALYVEDPASATVTIAASDGEATPPACDVSDLGGAFPACMVEELPCDPEEEPAGCLAVLTGVPQMVIDQVCPLQPTLPFCGPVTPPANVEPCDDPEYPRTTPARFCREERDGVVTGVVAPGEGGLRLEIGDNLKFHF